MTTSLATALAALALLQVEPTAPPDPPSDAPPIPAPVVMPRPAEVTGPRILPPLGLVPAGAPALRPDLPVRCLVGPSGTFRAQCDEPARRCLVAADAMLDAQGHPTGPLERADPCAPPALQEADLAGWEIVPALADAPPGYRRDQRQRASQVNFDVNRRFWLGGGWAAGGTPGLPAGVVSAGLRLDHAFPWAGAPALARLHVLEGWSAVDGSAAQVSGVAADVSRAYPHPLLRLTTFFGPPRRYDPPLYAGVAAEALRYERLTTRSGARYERLGAFTGAATLDFWRSADLSCFLRLRSGLGFEKVSGPQGGDLVAHAFLDGDTRLDDAGLLSLRGSAGSELVWATGTGPADPLHDRRWRHQARVELERIAFAVNDQPVSVVLQARATQRTDVPDWTQDWTFEATAQLRFNLWAPPLRAAARQEALERP
jgi:hypothetical protein